MSDSSLTQTEQSSKVGSCNTVINVINTCRSSTWHSQIISRTGGDVNLHRLRFPQSEQSCTNGMPIQRLWFLWKPPQTLTSQKCTYSEALLFKFCLWISSCCTCVSVALHTRITGNCTQQRRIREYDFDSSSCVKLITYKSMHWTCPASLLPPTIVKQYLYSCGARSGCFHRQYTFSSLFIFHFFIFIFPFRSMRNAEDKNSGQLIDLVFLSHFLNSFGGLLYHFWGLHFIYNFLCL